MVAAGPGACVIDGSRVLGIDAAAARLLHIYGIDAPAVRRHEDDAELGESTAWRRFLARAFAGSEDVSRRDVAQAVRIAAVAHDGSVLLSRVTRVAKHDEEARRGPLTLVRLVESVIREPLSVEALRRCFGITTAEARTADALVRFETLAEAAEALGLSRNTVRSHAASIYRKTGVGTRHQLLSILSRLAILEPGPGSGEISAGDGF